MRWIAFIKTHLFLLLCLFSLSTLASNIHVNVEVLGPSCTVNNGEIIEVDFGDEIVSTKLNGANYKQSFTFSLQCTSATANTVYLAFEGEKWEPGINALKTSKENLHIEFYRGLNLIFLNEKIAVSKDEFHTFQVTPIKYGSVKVQPGPFSASATTVVYYE